MWLQWRDIFLLYRSRCEAFFGLEGAQERTRNNPVKLKHLHPPFHPDPHQSIVDESLVHSPLKFHVVIAQSNHINTKQSPLETKVLTINMTRIVKTRVSRCEDVVFKSWYVRASLRLILSVFGIRGYKQLILHRKSFRSFNKNSALVP